MLRVLILLFSASCCLGQQIATTKEGKRVLLYDDFTWEYAENLTPSLSHDCSDYVDEIPDKKVKTGKLKVSRNMVYVGEPTDDLGLELFMVEDPEFILLETQIKGSSPCLEPGSMGIFTLEGGKEYKWENIAEPNCDGIAQFLLLLNNKAVLADLTGKSMANIRVFHEEGSVIKDVGEIPAQSFRKTVSCMLGR